MAGQRGIYFALPTQATSNQMFGRVCRFLSDRYAGDPSLPAILSHSHAIVSPEMLELLRRGELIKRLASVGEDSEGEIFASEWFTKPKRGLLTPFGIGTIDQALMAALITRHVFVRLFGLAGKVVIVDEVHAYDTYMAELLKRLLEWLGALNTSVILLSATLPGKRREELLASWARGAGRELGAIPPAAYPRLSLFHKGRHGPMRKPARIAALGADRCDLPGGKRGPDCVYPEPDRAGRVRGVDLQHGRFGAENVFRNRGELREVAGRPEAVPNSVSCAIPV